MGWLDDLSYWVRDNVVDPISDTIDQAGNKAFDSLDHAVDRIHEGGNNVIDAVCDPIGTTTTKDAANWVIKNPGKAVIAVAGVAATMAAVAGKASGSSGVLGAIDYGADKLDDSHDHRYNTGRDRTPAQKLADAARRNS